MNFSGLFSQIKLLKLCASYEKRFYFSQKGVYGFKPRQQRLSQQNREVLRRDNDREVNELVTAFRSKGHLLADLNPLQTAKATCSEDFARRLEIDIEKYEGSQREVDASEIVCTEAKKWKVNELCDFLKRTYCQTIGVEYMHLSQAREREWFAERCESLIVHGKETFPSEHKKEIAKLLLKSEAFDHFLATKFSTVKRYGGEGAETMLTFFAELFASSAQEDIRNIIIGMPHRGRLNLLTCLLNYPPVIMFQKMTGKPEIAYDNFEAGSFTGDVLSHLFTSVDLAYANSTLRVSLLPNPSHLGKN